MWAVVEIQAFIHNAGDFANGMWQTAFVESYDCGPLQQLHHHRTCLRRWVCIKLSLFVTIQQTNTQSKRFFLHKHVCYNKLDKFFNVLRLDIYKYFINIFYCLKEECFFFFAWWKCKNHYSEEIENGWNG